MDKDFSISLSLNSDDEKKKQDEKNKQEKDNSGSATAKEDSSILGSFSDSTSATFMVAIVSHMILNSMKN